MRTFRNNHKRGRYRNNDRNFKRNGETSKYNTDFSSNSNFQRKVPGKNNHNAPQLIEKYNDLAREALSKGDKILSENYFQHADHFSRINSTNTTPNNFLNTDKNSNLEEVKISSQDGETRLENDTLDKIEKNKTK